MSEGRPPLRLLGDEATANVQLADALRAALPRVHLLAASILIDSGALEAAWEPISEAVRGADDPRLQAALGEELLRLARGWRDRRQRHAAGDALRLAAQLVPKRGLPALARHLQREGSQDEALALWARAIDLDPGDADHHLRFGRSLELRGRLQDAHSAYLRLIEEMPTASNALTVAPRLQRLADRLPPVPGAVVRIAMLGSATLDQLRDCLVVQAHRAGMRPEVHVAPADRYAHEMLDPGSDLHRFAPDVLILAIHRGRLFPDLDGFPDRLSTDRRREAIRSGVDSLRRLLRGFRAHSSALVLLHNMVVPQRLSEVSADRNDELGGADIFHRINLELGRLVSGELRDACLVDEDGVQGRYGKAAATDPRYWLAAGMPWSPSMLMPLAREQLRHVLAGRGRARTCLVVGLDDTLWGGQVAAAGVAGVRLGVRAPGNAFLLFQRQLDDLWRRGLQLAVCSRADRDEAGIILEDHPHMVVRPGHFAASRIGCTSTPEGVREIAGELGIALERVVFWDGDAAERARMRAALPAVLTPEVPADPARHRQTLVDLALFDSLDPRASPQ